MTKKIGLLILLGIFFLAVDFAFAHQPRLVYLHKDQEVNVINPELSQAFYDELKGQPKAYIIDSEKSFELYLNLLTPAHSNTDGKYSADVYLLDGETETKISTLNGADFVWVEFYEEFGRDYYFKGPEFSQNVEAGKYKIVVYSANNTDNFGKYVLAVGKKEQFGAKDILSVYWQLPLLKITYFKTSVLQFFLTSFGIAGIGAIGVLLVVIALIYYLIGLIKTIIKHNEAKTMLLTSGGMPQMKDEILQLLQKPAYDVTVGFINTAGRYKSQENPDYVYTDLATMRDELGFNVEEIDISGKKEAEVMRVLELKDIIFVAGGNTFFLLKSMRECNFGKIVRKLMKLGKVYIGVSAGSIVAGQTIKTAGWKDADKNVVGLKNLKGLGLVPFDIFVHYTPDWAETIKQQIPNSKKRAKKLRIITDDQAILVQGKEVSLIGDGEQVIL